MKSEYSFRTGGLREVCPPITSMVPDIFRPGGGPARLGGNAGDADTPDAGVVPPGEGLGCKLDDAEKKMKYNILQQT